MKPIVRQTLRYLLLAGAILIGLVALMTGMRKLAHPHGGFFQFEVDLPACVELCRSHGGVYTWAKEYDHGPPSSQLSTYCECDR